MAGIMEYRNSVKIRLGTWNIGTLNWKGLWICDGLWKRNVDMCCSLVVRWRGCGARLIGLQGRRYILWWSGNQEGCGGVGVLVKQELYDKVVEVGRVIDRVMSLPKVCEGEVLRVVWAYAPQSGKSMEEKEIVYEDVSREWATHHMNQLIIGMGDFKGHVDRNIDGFQDVHGGFTIGE